MWVICALRETSNQIPNHPCFTGHSTGAAASLQFNFATFRDAQPLMARIPAQINAAQIKCSAVHMQHRLIPTQIKWRM